MPELPLNIDTSMPNAARGRSLQQVGRSALNLLDTLTQAASRGIGTAAKALYDGAVFTELTEAQRYAMSAYNEWDYAAQNSASSDWEATWRGWEDRRRAIEEEAASKYIKAPEARDKFAAWWMTEAEKAADTYRQQAIEAIDVNAEVAATTAIEVAKRMGRDDLVKEIAFGAYASGAYTRLQATKAAVEGGIVARYNKALNQLNILKDPEAVLGLLETEDIGKRYELPEDGDFSVKSLRTFFQEQGASNRARAERQRVEKAAEVFTNISQKWHDGSITGPELDIAVGQTAGTIYWDGIKGMSDKWDALYRRGADVIKESEQIKEFYALENSLYAWRRSGRNGDAPWDTKVLLAKYGNTTISEAQMKTLRDDWEKADESDAVVGFRSRIFGAMMPDTGEPQALQWTSMKTEIDKSYRSGNLTTIEHKSLLEDLLQAKGEYEKGLTHTEEKYDADAAGIVYHETMSMKDKRKWMKENKAHFSGERYSTWLGRINEYNGNGDRKQVIDALNAFFGQAAQGEGVTETRKRELAIEEYYAKETLEQIFINNPDNQTAWNTALNSLLSDAALRDLEDAIEKRFGAVYPMTLGITDERTLDILEAGREQKIGLEQPQLVARRAVRTGDIQAREEKLIAGMIGRAKINTSEIDADSGETLFYADNNMVYYVETAKEGNRLRRTVYGAKIGAADFTVVGRE